MNMADAPGDLWDKLNLRLRSYAYKRLRGHGIAIVTVRLVLQDGMLVAWNDPEAACFEPLGNGAEGRLLSLLAQGFSVEKDS